MPDPKSIRKIDADDYYAYPKEEYDNYSYLPKSDGTNKKIRKLRAKFIDHNTEIKNSDKYDRRITTYAHYSKYNADGTKKEWELHAGRGRKPYYTPIDNDPPDTAMIHYRKKGLKPKTDANTDSEKERKDALAKLLADREFANDVNPTKQHMKYASNKLVYASKSKPSK